jgi:two-component system response regulator AtoC
MMGESMARIVVVEDEEVLRGILVEEIEDMGHEALAADNGETALALIRETRPAVICSDVNMPGMNGLELRRRLESEGLMDPAPTFIFISANASSVDIADGLMAGADHYFTKPIDFDRLAAVIKDAIG